MARNKLKIILGAAILADLAMTAAVFVKTCLPTLEELNDAKVENAWRDLEEEYNVPIGFGETPDEGESNPEFDHMYDEVMSRPTPEARRRDPIDEGIDNILRYEVNGMTGFETEAENE